MDYMQLLKQYDDPIWWEYPQNFDYSAATARFAKFSEDLSAALGAKLVTETGSYIQDASFHSQVFVPVGTDRQVVVRFRLC